ncbi:hypothetical protein OG379_35220 [Streptomyces sp. NBC_01166]|uniref:hypothetical protein n=1 Tax=Streptomyces sp. NBC_01166 TaxID=2903755 RepID=UPI0038658AF3|nr:hypothetical protein OG379_35220 [Streptomyces sp. NBC_01166]
MPRAPWASPSSTVPPLGGAAGLLPIDKGAKEGNTAFGLVVPAMSLAVAIVLMGCQWWRGGARGSTGTDGDRLNNSSHPDNFLE